MRYLRLGCLVALRIEIHQRKGHIKQRLVTICPVNRRRIFDIRLLVARIARHNKIKCLCVVEITLGNAQLSLVKCRIDSQIINAVIAEHQRLAHLCRTIACIVSRRIQADRAALIIRLIITAVVITVHKILCPRTDKYGINCPADTVIFDRDRVIAHTFVIRIRVDQLIHKHRLLRHGAARLILRICTGICRDRIHPPILVHILRRSVSQLCRCL